MGAQVSNIIDERTGKLEYVFNRPLGGQGVSYILLFCIVIHH